MGEGAKERTRTLLRGIRSGGICVLYHDADMALRTIENVPASWPDIEAVMLGGDAAIFDPFTAERVIAVKRDVLVSGRPRRLEAMQQRDGEPPVWFEMSVERDEGPDGAPRGLFVSVADISLLKRREAALRELLYEVSHRSRNLLAILQSILGQTASSATSVAEFEEKFRGRIASLAQSQDLITYANWQGVRFRRLVEVQTEAFAADAGVAVEVEGRDPVLPPNVTLHLGLALHELAANARSFGVLAAEAGRLRVRCEIIPGGCRIEWIEEPDRPVGRVQAWGFGRTILQNVTPRALSGEAHYSVGPEGVRYSLDFPVREEQEAAS
ncbi:sensor histidine kinase [Amaricoccus sp.]|uniref:sensor histidine kinase n=1 Tax=Amaricoccus sp. TaxID=1872485 RepID=UPI001B3F12DE|nr:sensor histidine kinase [Amaricoccus sp.]MBP7000365.1 sensor histidine kinase [Amaricoccus sp.]